jgi:hypothetical protein
MLPTPRSHPLLHAYRFLDSNSALRDGSQDYRLTSSSAAAFLVCTSGIFNHRSLWFFKTSLSSSLTDSARVGRGVLFDSESDETDGEESESNSNNNASKNNNDLVTEEDGMRKYTAETGVGGMDEGDFGECDFDDEELDYDEEDVFLEEDLIRKLGARCIVSKKNFIAFEKEPKGTSIKPHFDSDSSEEEELGSDDEDFVVDDDDEDEDTEDEDEDTEDEDEDEDTEDDTILLGGQASNRRRQRSSSSSGVGVLNPNTNISVVANTAAATAVTAAAAAAQE